MPRDVRIASPFGEQLRHWRLRAGLSQVELAAQAETTPRHLSFLETGRSRPGRELALRLAATLDVPLRERNALLVAAGLAPAFPMHPLDDEAMLPVKRVLERILAAHEPFPAWVVGPGFRFVASNRGAEALFPGMCGLAPETLIDAWFGAGPFRDLVENWREVVRVGVDALRREARRTGNNTLTTLLARAEKHATAISNGEGPATSELPVACPRLNIGGRIIRTISAVMRFDTATDVTASELRVELMFPADDESDAFLRSAVVGRGS